ncbi:hypothetical protein GCM10010252_47090 [Streptomyces aureoverticillatus]|nr:hypothetical protein GCM10010252_47090 [Streptomyces aureoverticillatus]
MRTVSQPPGTRPNRDRRRSSTGTGRAPWRGPAARPTGAWRAADRHLGRSQDPDISLMCSEGRGFRDPTRCRMEGTHATPHRARTPGGPG